MPKFTPALQELENTFTEPQTGPFVDQGGSVGFDVRAYGAVLDGASDDAAALNAALAAVQAAGVQVVTVAGGAARIASNVTIPSGVTLRVLEGATIKPAAGATLTINGTFDAGLYSVFDLSEGGSVVLGRGATERALPQWWGARGDGVTDDTAAIDAWLAQAGELFLPTGIYLADAFTPRSDSTIRCAAGAEVVCRTQTEVFALLSNLNDVTIEGLHIDGANLTTRCIYILSCSSVTLLNPKVENLFQPSGAAVEAVGIRITNGRNILIRDPVIRNVVATPDSITGNTPGLARGIHISAVDPAVLENIRIHGGLIEDIEPLEDADGIACFAPDYGDGASNHDVVIDGVTIRRAHKRAVKIQMNGVRVQNCRIF
ncbi:MAG TPA: right-handed parallel beta-helix repeat-containing protein, partial [Longimicrobiales bacterium]